MESDSEDAAVGGAVRGLQQAAGQVDESQLTRLEAIINSMTQKERHNHEIISGEPEEADCGRLGDDGAGSEPAAAAVCADAQDVQGDWQGRRDAAAAGDGDAGGDAGAVGKGAGYRLQGTGCRFKWSVVSGQWSVVSDQWSVISAQRTVIRAARLGTGPWANSEWIGRHEDR